MEFVTDAEVSGQFHLIKPWHDGYAILNYGSTSGIEKDLETYSNKELSEILEGYRKNLKWDYLLHVPKSLINELVELSSSRFREVTSDTIRISILEYILENNYETIGKSIMENGWKSVDLPKEEIYEVIEQYLPAKEE